MTTLKVAHVPRRDAEGSGELRLGQLEFGAKGCNVHAHSSHIALYEARGNPRNNVSDTQSPSAQAVRMPRKVSKAPANHLRAWREYRGLSQEALAVLVGTAGNVIGLLETGERGLSDKWLRKLAPVLGTTPGRLLDYSPDDLDSAYLEAALGVAKEDRPQVLQIISTFKKTGTDG